MLRRWVKELLAGFGLFVLVITLFPWPLNFWTDRLSGSYNNPHGDILIILGGDQLDTHVIGMTSYWRSIYAALVWRTGGFREILICGGPSKMPVAEPMRDFLVSQGVPATAIHLEPDSDSTRENAVNAARMLANTPGKKILLSSDYHMLRAARAFRKVGLDITPTYFPDAAKRNVDWRNRWRIFLDLTGETAKLFWYWLHGWV